jgi:hypothetical protein
MRTQKKIAMRVLFGIFVLSLVAATSAWAQTAEENLKQKNITLPVPPGPVANYVPAVQGSLT